jgi:hypothetical protein
MKTAFRIVLIAALGGLGFWLWTVLFPSPEKLVLKKVSSLAATATISADAGNFTRAGKVSSIIGFFSTDAQIVITVSGEGSVHLNGRDEIREAAAGGFTRLKSLDVKFLDATAKVSPDKQDAEVNCTAEIHVNGSKDFGVQELRFVFKKIDKDWLIIRVESVKTLS